MKRQWIVLFVSSACLFALLFVYKQASAQSASVFEVSLADMGFLDEVVYGPRSSTFYSFNLSPSWEMLDGSYFIMDYEYRVRAPEGTPFPLAALSVEFNEQEVYTEDLFLPTAQQVRIELPADAFRLSEEERANAIEVIFTEYSDCESAVLSSVKISNISLLHLVHGERPLQIDLAQFPQPIYQRRSLERSHVRLILPDEPDESDLAAAAIVSARLGQLTAHGLPISVTLASELADNAFPAEHLIVIGTPDDNPLIRQMELPLPLRERQLMLHSQMPMTISAGSRLSYTLFVENTSAQTRTLIVEDRFPPVMAQFLECSGSCQEVTAGQLRWDVGTLEAGQTASTTVTLEAASAISPSMLLRHTASLLDIEGNILNVDSLVSEVGDGANDRYVASPGQKLGSFFVQRSQAVPEDGGVLQEIISPWSNSHVIVIVTGTTDEALLKAARGLNPENRFPGMWGNSAIVRDIQSPSTSAPVLMRDFSFASLGYDNRELSVVDLGAADYLFDFPPRTTLGEDSYLALHLAHAETVASFGGEIKVTLNGIPVGSVALDDGNLGDAWHKILLNKAAVQPGTNSIRIQAVAKDVDRCLIRRNNPYWLVIYDDSAIHLSHKPAEERVDLSAFPYPFDQPGDLGNLVFALPNAVTEAKVEGMLRIASLLGSGSTSKELIPRVEFAGGIDLDSLMGVHVIALGLPTENRIIRNANNELPQAFLPDSNDIYQSIDSPIYGIPSGTSLGFVQELVSPWDTPGEHFLLVATGTTVEGVQWALSALSLPADGLSGNLSIVRGEQVYSTDTRPGPVEEILAVASLSTATPQVAGAEATMETPASTEAVEPTATGQPTKAEITPTPSPEPVETQVVSTVELDPAGPSGPARPAWLLPVLVVSLLMVVAASVWVIRQVR